MTAGETAYPDLVVGADWLAERIAATGAGGAGAAATGTGGAGADAPEPGRAETHAVGQETGRTVVVDVRDPWEYEGIGHLPGAVSVPFEEFRGGGEVGMLPPADAWAALLGEAGATAGDHLVAYDDDHGVFAARFLVTAWLLGHDPARLHLLDGDYTAWMREHETTTEPADPGPATYEPRADAVGGSADPDSPLVDAEAVAAATGDPDAVVVDTREPWEYEEGHVPGAVQLDWRALVDEGTRRLKPRGAMRDLLAERGVEPVRRVVLYCNTARRISHTFLVLRWLGFERVDFYEGSLTEWTDQGRPVETGSE